MAPTGPGTKTFEIDQSIEPGGSEMFGTLGSVAEWQRRTNVWRKATNPARTAKRLRSGSANERGRHDAPGSQIDCAPSRAHSTQGALRRLSRELPRWKRDHGLLHGQSRRRG